MRLCEIFVLQSRIYQFPRLLQPIPIVIHPILLFAHLIELRRCVEVDHVEGEKGALLDVALHACILVDERVDDVTVLVGLLCRGNRGVGGVAADAVEVLPRLEIALSGVSRLQR